MGLGTLLWSLGTFSTYDINYKFHIKAEMKILFADNKVTLAFNKPISCHLKMYNLIIHMQVVTEVNRI